MDIPHSLCFVIQKARSLQEILDSAVDLIAREMGTDVCSIYLLDPRDHRLRLMATRGLDPAALGKVTLALGEGLTGIVVQEMRSLAVEDASSHPGYRYFPETREEQFKSYLGVPLAIQRRPVGAIVVQTREHRTYSEREVQTLSAISAQLVGVVENARLIDALERGEAGARYLEEVRSWRTRGQLVPEDRTRERVYVGTPASPGVVIGSAWFCASPELAPELHGLPFQGVETELKRLDDALDRTRAEIVRIQGAAEREAGEEHAMIFSSHLLLLNDPVLRKRIHARIEALEDAYRAVFTELEHFSVRLQNVPDAYIQDRVEDIRDLRSRILGKLVAPRETAEAMSDRIVVSRGIPPSLVVELKAEKAKGIVTERGGPTSHGMLLARSMGIPAVAGVVDVVLHVRSGETLILDGSEGKLIVSPSPATVEEYERRQDRHRSRSIASLRYREGPTITKDGVRVAVHANVGVTADLLLAAENGAEGIGLYRTEFPFIIRDSLPSLEEQVRLYAKAYQHLPDRPIVFRLLDLGGDKFLPSNALGADRNPFRGYRSIRVLLENPEVLRDQVRAFALAAGQRPLSILIPMVTSLAELRRTREHIRETLAGLEGREAQRNPRVGAMIEVPAAVELAPEIGREADFLSIGSNDLIQYALAADRDLPGVSSPTDSYHPAVLRLIRRTVAAGHEAGRPVSICGEMAANTRLAILFVAMGIDSLSVTPSAIPDLKRAFASAEIGPVRDDLARILALGEAEAIFEALGRHLPADDAAPAP